MSRSRVPLVLGLTAVGGAGYYLYGAGGSPKVAEKNFEGTLQDYRIINVFYTLDPHLSTLMGGR